MNWLRKNFWEIFRFCLTGVANTAVYYVVYLLLFTVMPYLAAHIIGWLAGTIFSFYVNCLFTFKVRPTLKRFLAFPAAPLSNLLISTLAGVALIEWVGVPARWGTLLGGIIAIPASFFVARFVLKRPDPVVDPLVGPIPNPIPDPAADQSAAVTR